MSSKKKTVTCICFALVIVGLVLWFQKREQLNLKGRDISDISHLAGRVNLNSLKIDQTSVRDLSPLKDLINLEVLKVQRTKISDIRPLKALTNLRALSLHQRPRCTAPRGSAAAAPCAPRAGPARS